MRAFICNIAGSGGSIVTDLDPADWWTDPSDGTVITQSLTPDPFRPAVEFDGPYWCDEVPARGNGVKMLVVARDVTTALGSTYDLGDPTNPDDMNRALTAPERNTLEQLTGEPNGTFDGMTVGDVFLWARVSGRVVFGVQGWSADLPVVEYPPATNPRVG